MPSSITFYGQDYFAGMVFGATHAQPANYWIALCTQVPPRSATGATLLEPPSSSGYSRLEVPNTTAWWGQPAGGVVANINQIQWPVVTNADWPTLYAYALCDAPTGGNVYIYGTLRVPRAAPVGHQVSFDVGLITFSVNPISPTIVPST